MKNAAFNYLIRQKENHSKLDNVQYTELRIQPYLATNLLNNEEKSLLYSLRSKCHPEVGSSIQMTSLWTSIMYIFLVTLWISPSGRNTFVHMYGNDQSISTVVNMYVYFDRTYIHIHYATKKMVILDYPYLQNLKCHLKDGYNG